MIPKPSPITPNQFQKIVKSLYYSFSSGFIGGFILAVTGALPALVSHSGSVALGQSLITALVTGGVVGGLNSLAVTVKQLFTNEVPPVL